MKSVAQKQCKRRLEKKKRKREMVISTCAFDGWPDSHPYHHLKVDSALPKAASEIGLRDKSAENISSSRQTHLTGNNCSSLKYQKAEAIKSEAKGIQSECPNQSAVMGKLNYQKAASLSNERQQCWCVCIVEKTNEHK